MGWVSLDTLIPTLRKRDPMTDSIDLRVVWWVTIGNNTAALWFRGWLRLRLARQREAERERKRKQEQERINYSSSFFHHSRVLLPMV